VFGVTGVCVRWVMCQHHRSPLRGLLFNFDADPFLFLISDHSLSSLSISIFHLIFRAKLIMDFSNNCSITLVRSISIIVNLVWTLSN
jgi:hypothetical protein